MIETGKDEDARRKVAWGQDEDHDGRRPDPEGSLVRVESSSAARARRSCFGAVRPGCAPPASPPSFRGGHACDPGSRPSRGRTAPPMGEVSRPKEGVRSAFWSALSLLVTACARIRPGTEAPPPRRRAAPVRSSHHDPTPTTRAVVTRQPGSAAWRRSNQITSSETPIPAVKIAFTDLHRRATLEVSHRQATAAPADTPRIFRDRPDDSARHAGATGQNSVNRTGQASRDGLGRDGP